MKSFASKRRRPIDVLRNVTLDIPSGQFISIVGPSGSGKSTLLHCLSGLSKPTSGAVTIEGESVENMPNRKLIELRRSRVGFVFQQYALVPALTVRENVILQLRVARAHVTTIEPLLSQLGIADVADQLPAEISGGQAQRTAVARALSVNPRILFADEPTGALDSVAGATVLDALRASAGDSRTVILVTHDIDAAARADRSLVLRDGQIVADLVSPSRPALFAALEAAGR